MGTNSPIEWTDVTWNPVTGCTKISPGCKHCYAERMSMRLQAMGQRNYRNGFDVTLQPHMLELPLRLKSPRRIFVNSMSDLFHEDVPLSYIQDVFAVMRRAHWHQYQVLTKRSERLRDTSPLLEWVPQIWMGVSVESEDYSMRIDHLRETAAHIKFLSIEPLLGSLPHLNLLGIDWVILGGESGPGARPLDPAWVTDIRDQCTTAGVAFFFKQWGGVFKKRTGRELEGRTWDELPQQQRGANTPVCRVETQLDAFPDAR
ncbi:MAG TPA: phage Gp37/Gp68 family protein [Bryobacteraceae bacterium]|nr:phage Gp37/Gp68 family protein [Bryobacteraceae bacterium]